MTQMTRLVDDLLDLARITSNRIELRSERIELSAVLNAAVEISRPLIESRGHEFTVHLPNEPVMIDGDLTRLAQAVSNLLNNAAKLYRNGGAIRLEAEAGRTRSRNKKFITRHRHRRRDDAAHFEMFTQVEASMKLRRRSRRRSDAGKKTDRKHNGTVEAQSGGEKGSTIRSAFAGRCRNRESKVDGSAGHKFRFRFAPRRSYR